MSSMEEKLEGLRAKAEALARNRPKASPEQLAMSKKVIDNLLVYFVHDFPWASQIFYCMEKHPVPGMGTMGVGVSGDRLHLVYDPLFVLSMERSEIGFVMVHEALHVMFHHVTKRIPQDQGAAAKWNIAADLAINCLIPRGSTCMMPTWKKDPVDGKGNPLQGGDGKPIKKGDRMGVLPKDYKAEDKKAMEWYFNILPKQDPSGGGGSPGSDGDGQDGDSQSLDMHDLWEASELVDQEIKNTVERISKNRQWGNMDGETQSAIQAAQVAEVPWYKILRHALGDLMSKSKIKSMKKVNRRIPMYPWKGNIKTGVDNKLVAFDTSGSVGDEELDKFLCEVNRLVEDEQPVDAICFDTRVIGKPRPFVRAHRKYSFKGRGGTCFNPVVQYAKDHRYKHLILFTDGYAECPQHQQGLDIIWVLTPDGTDTPPSGYQGRYIKMKKLKDKNFR